MPYIDRFRREKSGMLLPPVELLENYLSEEYDPSEDEGIGDDVDEFVEWTPNDLAYALRKYRNDPDSIRIIADFLEE